MMPPWNHAEIRRHFKFVNDPLTNYILLIIKLVLSFRILDVSDGEASLIGKSCLEIKA